MDKHIEELREAYTDVEITAHNLRGNPEEYRAVTGFCPVNVIEMQAKKILELLAKLEAAEKERDALLTCKTTQAECAGKFIFEPKLPMIKLFFVSQSFTESTTSNHRRVEGVSEHVHEIIDLEETVSELKQRAEAAEKEIGDWRSIAEAAAQDDADWHKLVDSRNEVIVQLAQGIIKLKGRAVAAEIDRDLHYRVSKKLRIELIATEYALSAANEKLKAADQELIKPLPIGELVHRLEGQTYRKWYDDDEINKWRERAEAAEARLLVPVKLPKYCERYHWSDGVFNFKEDIIAAICAAGYPVEGESIATLAPAPAGVVMRPPFEKTLERCAAARDGECSHKDCPQIRDNEPMATGRHCPIDDWEE